MIYSLSFEESKYMCKSMIVFQTSRGYRYVDSLCIRILWYKNGRTLWILTTYVPAASAVSLLLCDEYHYHMSSAHVIMILIT